MTTTNGEPIKVNDIVKVIEEHRHKFQETNCIWEDQLSHADILYRVVNVYDDFDFETMEECIACDLENFDGANVAYHLPVRFVYKVAEWPKHWGRPIC